MTRRTKMPRKLKLGHVWATVDHNDHLATDTAAVGLCGEDDQRILIQSKLGPDIERETLLHEAMHLLWHSTTLDKLFSDEQEEQIVWSLAPVLLATLRENPELVDFLLAGVGDD